LHDWAAQYNMELTDAILASNSPAERGIYKLLDYVAKVLNPNSPPKEEARTKGLKVRQIRYFLRSYEPTEEKLEEYEFIDEIRSLFERLDSAYHLIGSEKPGWMTSQKVNKHLENLIRVRAIEKVDGRYRQVEGQYYTPGLPNYYKRMVKGVPAEWMVPYTGEVRTNLVFLNSRDRLISPGRKKKGRPTLESKRDLEEMERRLDAFEIELLTECDAFGVRAREVYEKHFGKLDLSGTRYERGFKEFLHVTSPGGLEYMRREKERDPEGWAERFGFEEADYNEWKKLIHQYWRSMPVLVIDPRPRPDQVPQP
jgi:hypothetical protein